MTGIKILATGCCLPQRVVTNDDLAKVVDTNDEWIVARSGIRRRRYATPEEDTTTLAIEAARAALEQNGIMKEKIGGVVVATLTSTYLVPNTACMIQKELGLPEDLLALDINSGCSGFLYGLRLAQSLLTETPDRYILVVGVEVLSKIINFEDRSTCVLFGDGAGAVVVAAAPEQPFFFIAGAKGEDKALYCPGLPPREADVKPFHIEMDGREVFRFAVGQVPIAIQQVLEAGNIGPENVDWYLCHQANARIITHISKTLGQPQEKFFMNLEEYGNTSAASIPIALDEMHRSNLLQRGQKIVIAGFGGGLTWGAALLEW